MPQTDLHLGIYLKHSNKCVSFRHLFFSGQSNYSKITDNLKAYIFRVTKPIYYNDPYTLLITIETEVIYGFSQRLQKKTESPQLETCHIFHLG